MSIASITFFYKFICLYFLCLGPKVLKVVLNLRNPLVENLPTKRRVPRKGFREGQRLAKSINYAKDTAQASCVAHSAINRVPTCELVTTTFFVETHAKDLRAWLNYFSAWLNDGRSNLQLSSVCHSCSWHEPYPIGLCWIQGKAKVVGLRIRKGRRKLKRAEYGTKFSLFQRSNNGKDKLEIFCQKLKEKILEIRFIAYFFFNTYFRVFGTEIWKNERLASLN